MEIYRNTHENWLLKLLKDNHIDANGRFISFSLTEDSGGQDNFGDTRIVFDRDLLDDQGLEEIFYEADYFDTHPEISQYVCGYENEQDFYDGQDYDNEEEAAEQLEMDWNNNVESYEHEQELVMKKLTYKDGIISNVIFSTEPNEELKQLLDKNQIEYTVKMKEFKTFEGFNKNVDIQDRLIEMGCTFDGKYYSCDKRISLSEDFVKNGKLAIKFDTVKDSFDLSNLNLTTLEGSPKKVAGNFRCNNNQLTSLEGGPNHVGRDFICFSNKLTSLEGGPIFVGADYHCDRNSKLTSLKGSPKKVQYFGISDLPELKTLHEGPESINTSPDFHKIKSEYLSGTEHGYWLRLLISGQYNNNTYFKEMFGLMIAEDNLEEIYKIQWPQEILDMMPDNLRNLYRSKVGGNKFNMLEYYNVLRFEEFVNEGLDKYYGKLDLTENIKTDTSELLSSVDLKEVNMHETLDILVSDINLEGMTLDQLADNNHFIESLEKLSLKKEDPHVSTDSDTFLTKSLTFMGIYPVQVLEIQDPEYLMVQIGNGPIKLYKLSRSIKDFYDKLTSKTVEITAGDKNWIYKTSNSGTNWELQNQKEGEVYKKVMSTQELEDSLNSNTKITVIS